MTLALESASRSRWEAWHSAVPSIRKTSNTTVNNRNRGTPSARKCRFIFPSSAGYCFREHTMTARALPRDSLKPALEIPLEARVVGRDALGYLQLFGVGRVAFLEGLGTQFGDSFFTIVAGAEA